jgi:hypothetical protein
MLDWGQCSTLESVCRARMYLVVGDVEGHVPFGGVFLVAGVKAAEQDRPA